VSSADRAAATRYISRPRTLSWCGALRFNVSLPE
jgi:hypothetical protein